MRQDAEYLHQSISLTVCVRPILVSLQAISSISEGVSIAASSTEEPMQTDETASAEAAPAEEPATAMETQAEVNALRCQRLWACQSCAQRTFDLQFVLSGRSSGRNSPEPALRADV